MTFVAYNLFRWCFSKLTNKNNVQLQMDWTEYVVHTIDKYCTTLCMLSCLSVNVSICQTNKVSFCLHLGEIYF